MGEQTTETARQPDFSGWVTKANLKCTDGRTIMPDAFKHQDTQSVPLVWSHRHDDPNNVLGHVILSNRAEGVWGDGYLNHDTPQGKNALALVSHGDVKFLSIWANELIERAKSVFHGAIKEVSLVLAGANPGAVIEQVRIAHSSDPSDDEILSDEAIISFHEPIELVHGETASAEDIAGGGGSADAEDKVDEQVSSEKTEDAKVEVVAHADTTDPNAKKTYQDVYETLDDDQKELFSYAVATALEEGKTEASAAAHSENKNEDDLSHENKEGSEEMTVTHNVFENKGEGGTVKERPHLSHDQLKTIVEDAPKYGGSFKDSFLAHAQEYGIEDIDLLFPDAKAITSTPEFISRRMEWVATVLDGAKHSPFARIKTLGADITAEEARAKGYVKGNLKKDEIIKLIKRVTIPTTIYKKQKLDRDDVVDITELDVVVWLKGEMRLMLEEELARAILIGDGREPDDEDKIDEDKLRPIAWDNEMYAHSVTVPANTTPDGTVEAVIRARKFYKGSGRPTFFTTDDALTDMLLIKDKMGRYVYNTEMELAAKLRVDKIVTVEVMEDAVAADILGIIVNMVDYTIGADKGGQLAMFDDFDIDYNQLKYLMETRVSGALTKFKSAVVIKRTGGTQVTPAVPAFDPETNTLTVPTVAGVSYFNVTDPLAEVELTDGADVVITETTDVEARADAGYNFPHGTDADWTFAYTA